MRRTCLAGVLGVLGVLAGPLGAQERLELPPRPADALEGSAVVEAIRGAGREAREARIVREVEGGNVPSWLRSLQPVEMVRTRGGRVARVTFWVTPDYLSVGSDQDAFRMPLSPAAAQRIADLVGASLPTPAMVDAVWASAEVRLGPDSISPGTAMTTVPVFERHEAMVDARRAVHRSPPGALVAGHKKDVVLSSRLDTSPDRVAIYGWHRPGGDPIQPLYTGHTADWVDYSHGIRLVGSRVLVDGEAVELEAILRNPALAWLLSDEGVIRRPRYRYEGHQYGAYGFRVAANQGLFCGTRGVSAQSGVPQVLN